jgi:hypothetical protein
MSIIVENFTDTTQALTYMRSILVPTYFASATYNSSDGSLFKDSDGNVLLRESNRNSANSAWYIYKSTSSYVYLDYDSTQQDQTYVTKIISCDGGVLIHMTGSNRSTPSGGLIITRGNDGKTVIIGNTNYNARGNTGGTTQVYRYTKVNMFKWGDVTSSNVQLTFTAQRTNQTQLVPFTTYCNAQTTSYTPDAFWMPFGEFYEVNTGKFLGPDGVEYVTNGYWAIRDQNSLAG